MIGVDEAGKGAVLGSMFTAAVDDTPIDYELKDSKELSAKRREKLAKKIKNQTKFCIIEITAEKIDKLLKKKTMDEIVIYTHSKAIKKFSQNYNISSTQKVMLDAAGPSPKKFTRYVSNKLDRKSQKPLSKIRPIQKMEKNLENNLGIKISSEHKADKKYKAVSAASILAKVERDKHIENIEEKIQQTIGSGYPGDSKTKKFLEKYIEKTGIAPDFTRISWETSIDILNQQKQSKINDYKNSNT